MELFSICIWASSIANFIQLEFFFKVLQSSIIITSSLRFTARMYDKYVRYVQYKATTVKGVLKDTVLLTSMLMNVFMRLVCDSEQCSDNLEQIEKFMFKNNEWRHWLTKTTECIIWEHVFFQMRHDRRSEWWSWCAVWNTTAPKYVYPPCYTFSYCTSG